MDVLMFASAWFVSLTQSPLESRGAKSNALCPDTALNVLVFYFLVCDVSGLVKMRLMFKRIDGAGVLLGCRPKIHLLYSSTCT